MKRTSLCSRAGAPNLQDLMPAHLKQSWYNNRNNVHNKCNAIESSSNQPPGPWKICLPGNQSLVPKSWELLLRFFERPSAGLLYKIWGGGGGAETVFGAGQRGGVLAGLYGSAAQILPSPGPVPLPRSATILNWAVWVGLQTFPLGTLVWSVQCRASTCSSLGASETRWSRGKKRLDCILLFSFYFYFSGTVKGLCWR